MSGEDLQRCVEAAIETALKPQLQALTEQIMEQNSRIRNLERWTLLPGDYDPRRQQARSIRGVIRETNAELLGEIFSWRNIGKMGLIASGVGGFVVTVLQIIMALRGLG